VTRTTPSRFLRVFGRRSPLAARSVAAFCNGLRRSFAARSSDVAPRLFETWRSRFGLRAGAIRRADRRRASIARWARGWLGLAVDEELFLFAVQCYGACVVKKFAATLAGTAPSDDFEHWRRVESGEAFRRAGIANFVNGDVFQAALQTRDDGVLDALRSIRSAFADGNDVRSADLQALHHDLLPRDVRHALGEYHTPVSLVDQVLEVAGSTADGVRVLDPMCGGGVFLTRIIERGRTAEANLQRGNPLAGLAGIELHPLATLLARASLLAAVSDPMPRDGVRLPIHHGDAILAAERKRASGASATLRVSTPVDEFELNSTTASEDVANALDRAGAFADANALVEDAKALAALEPFDFVVGNPAWIGWESLPEDDRRRTEPIWRRFGLFQQRGMDAILGGGKKDLSMLATYAAAEAWLKPGGVLGFVLNESAFRSVGAARGFRRFQLGDGDPLRVLRMEDLTRTDPFKNAATRTTVLALRKGEPTTYPVPVGQWTANSRRDAVAEPIDPDDLQSPWLTASAKVLPLLRRMLGPSSVRAYEGVNTGGANGVYWLSVVSRSAAGSLIVENDPSLGRANVPTVRAEMEASLVYPLLRHQDVERWKAAPSQSLLLLQNPTRRQGVDPAELERDAPKTLAFIRRFERHLRSRAAYRRYFERDGRSPAPFYSMFNVGTYTLAPIKVVWKRMTAPLEAAVVVADDDKPPMPQETLCFIPCRTIDEADYYAGLINSTPVNAAALAVSQGSSKSFGAPHLFKQVTLPAFDPQLESHRRLVDAAAAARSKSALGRDVDQAAAIVYGFTAAETAALADELSFLLGKR
jgi:hypothetical protein